MPAKLKCQSSDIVTVNQFKVATREYLKYNKKTEEVKTKTIKSYRSCIFTRLTKNCTKNLQVHKTVMQHKSTMYTTIIITGQKFSQQLPNVER